MGKLSEEISARTSGDLSLTNRVSAEESVRASADSSLFAGLSAEVSLRLAGDSSLTSRVSTEESVRASADTSLNGRISTESSFRVSADSSLTNRVSAEESVRASADVSLTNRVSAEESARASADTAILAACKDKVFVARVGGGFAAATSADGIALDTVSGSLYKSSDFNFGQDVVNMNLGVGLFAASGAAFPDNFQVLINGVALRPVFDSGKVKTFIDSATVSFSGLSGDYVFHKNNVGPVNKIHFAFALKAGDEIQVRYNRSR
jgi:hypothetical protein